MPLCEHLAFRQNRRPLESVPQGIVNCVRRRRPKAGNGRRLGSGYGLVERLAVLWPHARNPDIPQFGNAKVFAFAMAGSAAAFSTSVVRREKASIRLRGNPATSQ